MTNTDNKYNVSYTPSSDMTGLITLLWTPIESWDEGEPTYTQEEANKVIEFISNYEIPLPKNLDGWGEFKDTLNKEIYELYGK